MSDTPETDMEAFTYEIDGVKRFTHYINTDFARRLERERDEAIAEARLQKCRVAVLLLSVESAESELSKLRAINAELLSALSDAAAHLSYCGYGDSYESECAEENGLEDKIEAALTSAMSQA